MTMVTAMAAPLSSTAEDGWPSHAQMDRVREVVATMANINHDEVRIAVSPYRVCPLGAHIDHQGGSVVAMTINKGVLLGFTPSGGFEMLLRSAQFGGEVKFRIDNVPHRRCNGSPPSNLGSEVMEESNWGDYARGAILALQKRGHKISQGIVGFVNGSKGFHGVGISSSAAVGIAFLLALEHANNIHVSHFENIELDRLIENGYLGLNNGVLDQSAILLSQRDCLTLINCKDRTYELVYPQADLSQDDKKYKIMLAFSGLRHALSSKSGYNLRVSECQEAAKLLLRASRKELDEALLCNVTPDEYARHKPLLKGVLAKRAKHFFTENARVFAGVKAWKSGDLKEFGRLMSESGQSSIESYECGCEPMIQLLDILMKTSGVFGARFSGAGFRGCCVALVAAELAEVAASHVQEMYRQAQPMLAKQLEREIPVLICETGDKAHVC